MSDIEHLYLQACRKNALRKSSGLPLLDVRAEIAKERRREAILHYNEGFDRFANEYEAIRNRIVSNMQAKRGARFGQTSGSRMMIATMALAEFRIVLAARGYRIPPPDPNPIKYGGHSDDGNQIPPSERM